MLKMTALDGSGEVEQEQNKSATQFFALPASKKKKDPPPAPPVSGPVASGPGGRGLPSPSASNVSLQPHASPMGGGGGGMGISGPVASGTTSPFQVGQQVSIGDDLGDESRARTYRVYFIVVGLFAMVGFVACLGIGGVWWQVNNKEEPVETVSVAPAPKTKTKPKADTGAPAALPPPPPPVSRPRPRPSGGPRPAPKPVAPAAPTVRDVTINIPSGVFFTGAEVTCASAGFRGRGAFSGTSAKVSSVPPGDCAIHFKGGAPAKASVSGGASSYSCTFPSGVAVCK
ncbi:MAG: hypothetical protein KC912_22070 [Proteobacteria bacterium]|nr:hypothetical protein [Pseudomonadota bacterium]